MLWALTTGPTQPEAHGFTPATASDLVDPFTGDFMYNIPLVTLPGPDGGYPLNLAYRAGIGMEQEASWVGLGWSLNVGAINRQMRGVPDEFNGQDKIAYTRDQQPSSTAGLRVNWPILEEIWSTDIDVSFASSVYYNTYSGVGSSIGLNATTGIGSNANAGLGVNFDNQEGISVSPSLSFNTNENKGDVLGFGVTANYNSRAGLTSLNYDASLTNNNVITTTKKDVVSSRDLQETASGGASLSFVNRSFTPSPDYETSGFSIDATVKVGADITGLTTNGAIAGSYATSYMKDRGKRIESPAYGFLNSHLFYGVGVMDFNREKPGMLMENMPALSSPVATYDILSVSGQGIGSMFRPYRSEVGVYTDQRIVSTNSSVAAGFEVGAGTPFHLGLDASYRHTTSKSGMLEAGGDAATAMDFKATGDAGLYADYETYYYKTHGDYTSMVAGEVSDYAGFRPAHLEVVSDGSMQWKANDVLVDASGTKSNVTQNYTGARKPRTISIQDIKVADVAAGDEVLSEFDVQYYDAVSADWDPDDLVSLPRSTGPASDHHIAGYSALNAEGVRYIYGLPAYNKEHMEVAFSVEGYPSGSCQQFVDVPETTDNEVDYMASGTNHFFEKKEIPAYPHSYLLTSVLGPDYIDVTGDGLTDDDLGYWIKFNYVNTGDYKWRTPFVGANYIEGQAAKKADNKGTFHYGERETWHLASMESKTHIVEFSISDTRTDARGAASYIQNDDDPFASTVDARSYQLDQIDLYTKAERYEGGVLNTSASPEKSVHLFLSNGLCHGAPNAPDGKLRLDSLAFTYQDNTRGLDNPYRFTYSNNPDYHAASQDCWGTYKDLSAAASCTGMEFPYVLQDEDRSTLDEWAAAWSMDEIQTPSGSTISIEYEADDYAYVQNRRAMRLFDWVSPTTIGSTEDGNKQIIVTIPENERRADVTGLDPMELFLDPHEGKHWVYYSAFTELKESSLEDHVKGYAEVKDIEWGPAVGGVVTTLKITLEPVKKKASGSGVYGWHPVKIAAWDYLKYNYPKDVYNPGIELSENETIISVIGVFMSLVIMVKDIMSVIFGYYGTANASDFGKVVDPDRSYVRLVSSKGVKVGGGIRVKRVELQDHWTDGDEGIYGQEYSYTTSRDGEAISSGVATYEPMVGGEEIPQRFPLMYEQRAALRSNARHQYEMPFNESFYPAPSIGYSEVTVRSTATQSVLDGANHSSTGVTVHEFYTAKDFPVVSEATTLRSSSITGGAQKTLDYKRLSIPIPLIGSIEKTSLYATQGFRVELNDMHGKTKRISQFGLDEQGNLQDDPYAYQEFFYQSKPSTVGTESVQRLVNEVTTLQSNGTHAQKVIGVEYDVYSDIRKDQTESYGGGLAVNVEMLGFIPIPGVFPSIQTSKDYIHTFVTNKVVHRFGIMDSMVAYDHGSLVYTTNKVFDPLTGQALVTETNNAFGDPVYSYTYPARYAYSGMGAAYLNQGVSVGDANINATLFGPNIGDVSVEKGSVYHPGDELLLRKAASLYKVVVTEVIGDVIRIEFSDTPSPALNDPVWDDVELLLTRSGRRNVLAAPAGSITALVDPSDSDNWTASTIGLNACSEEQGDTCVFEHYLIDDVIAISATQWTDLWPNGGNELQLSASGTANYTDNNRFLNGFRGIWRPYAQHAYVDERTQTTTGTPAKADPQLRYDGVINDVSMFNWHAPDPLAAESKWIAATTKAKYNAFGFETEEKDVLGRTGAALYGYNGRMPLAVANNSLQHEIGFESFEEYETGVGTTPFNNSTGNLDFPSSSVTGSLTHYLYEDAVYACGELTVPFGTITNDWSPIMSTVIASGAYVEVGGVKVELPSLSIDSLSDRSLSFSPLNAITNAFTDTCSYPKRARLFVPVSIPTVSATHSGVSLATDVAHTGTQSLKCTATETFPQYSLLLTPGQKYVISFWEYSQWNDVFPSSSLDTSSSLEKLYQPMSIGFSAGADVPIEFDEFSPIIDGWRRIEQVFKVPFNASGTIELTLYTAPLWDRYFDDIRIHPVNASMNTYVYDRNDLRLQATLDENNFSTQYEYNDDGTLFLTRKETERGVFSLQETRTNIAK